MTAAAHPFCAQLVGLARKGKTRIVLPEMNDARVAEAAARANTDGIAECFAPPEDGAQKYLPVFMLSRAAKGMNENEARATLSSSPVVAAAAMVKAGDAEGMVAGAATASADVLRPALRIIGAGEGNFVSSLFFMCFDDGVKIFADCAMNINPTPEQLAAIAEQSAKTARRFNIEPRVAVLSYATGDSAGDTEETRKACEAVSMIKQAAPSLPLIGPIQYDAAVNKDIGKRKAPNNPTAGNATILIFPNLSAGNITYKAVQQSAGIIAIGPILQGMSSPVNDLSRGASVDDIYYTIAATAAQATGS